MSRRCHLVLERTEETHATQASLVVVVGATQAASVVVVGAAQTASVVVVLVSTGDEVEVVEGVAEVAGAEDETTTFAPTTTCLILHLFSSLDLFLGARPEGGVMVRSLAF